MINIGSLKGLKNRIETGAVSWGRGPEATSFFLLLSFSFFHSSMSFGLKRRWVRTLRLQVTDGLAQFRRYLFFWMMDIGVAVALKEQLSPGSRLPRLQGPLGICFMGCCCEMTLGICLNSKFVFPRKRFWLPTKVLCSPHNETMSSFIRRAWIWVGQLPNVCVLVGVKSGGFSGCYQKERGDGQTNVTVSKATERLRNQCKWQPHFCHSRAPKGTTGEFQDLRELAGLKADT